MGADHAALAPGLDRGARDGGVAARWNTKRAMAVFGAPSGEVRIHRVDAGSAEVADMVRAGGGVAETAPAPAPPDLQATLTDQVLARSAMATPACALPVLVPRAGLAARHVSRFSGKARGRTSREWTPRECAPRRGGPRSSADDWLAICASCPEAARRRGIGKALRRLKAGVAV